MGMPEWYYAYESSLRFKGDRGAKLVVQFFGTWSVYNILYVRLLACNDSTVFVFWLYSIPLNAEHIFLRCSELSLQVIGPSAF